MILTLQKFSNLFLQPITTFLKFQLFWQLWFSPSWCLSLITYSITNILKYWPSYEHWCSWYMNFQLLCKDLDIILQYHILFTHWVWSPLHRMYLDEVPTNFLECNVITSRLKIHHFQPVHPITDISSSFHYLHFCGFEYIYVWVSAFILTSKG